MTPELKQLMFKDYQKIPDEFKCQYCKESMYEYPNASKCESCEYEGTKFVMCINYDCKLFQSFCCRSWCIREYQMLNNIYFQTYTFENQLNCLIFSTSYVSLTEQLPDVIRTLKSIDFKGLVIFDLLLSNGNSLNRFISSTFDGISFNDFVILNDQKEIQEVRGISSAFYSQNHEFVENSILSKSEKRLIQNGVII